MRSNKYYIIYKPFQVMSQFSPVEGKQTLADYFKVEKDVYPVGRLDYDSEGLLLLTNDSSLNHRLLNPNFAHQRTYWVQVDNDITDEAIQKLENGVLINIDGKSHKTLPATAFKMPEEPNVPERNPPIRVRKNIPTSWISLTLQEGKNRQVRRMTAAVGFPTLRLIRYSIEKLTIQNMLPGDMISLNQQEINRLLLENKPSRPLKRRF
jgi:23S rRNA pseudouridine2457 synthase